MIDSIDSGPATKEGSWWALYTKHQHEKRVAEMLLAKGVEVFLPLYDEDRRRRDRTVRLTLPLFPSYVFVRACTERQLAVISTPGVHQIVSQGSAFGVIPEQEIQNLRIAISAERAIESLPFCRVGEYVRITRGPLQGLEGLLLRQKGLCRVILSIQMLAKSVAVEVDVGEIAPVRSCPPGPISITRSAACY